MLRPFEAERPRLTELSAGRRVPSEEPSGLSGFIERIEDADPTQVDRRDAKCWVWAPNAFPSFGLSADFDVVRRIFASARRPDPAPLPADGSLPLTSLLPTIACGYVGADGRRCGRGIATLILPDKGLIYRAIDCWRHEPRHRTDFYATTEIAILEIIANAYDPNGMQALIADIAIRTRALRARQRAIEDQLVALATELEGVARGEALAMREEDQESGSFWGERRRALVKRRSMLQREQADLATRLEGMEDSHGVERQLKIAAQVASDLPELFRRARAFHRRTSELVNLLVTRMAIRQLTPGIMLFELELPTGQVTQHLILSDSFRCSQPERVLAYIGLRRGDSPEGVAARLSDARRHRGTARIANAETVQAFGLLHAYFECVESRLGDHRSVGQLAQEYRLSERDLWELALDGRLGPARVSDDGELLFRPTPAEAIMASPWLGRLSVADRLGVAPESLVSMQALCEAVGTTSDELRRRGVQRQKGACDDARRMFLRRDAVPDPLLQALESLSPTLIAERQRTALRSELRRADFDPEEADYWQREHVVRAKFRERLGYSSVSTLRNAAKRGRIDIALFHVREPGRRAHSLTSFVFIEPQLLEHGSLTAVKAWLGGIGPHATRTGDGRRARVSTRGRRARDTRAGG